VAQSLLRYHALRWWGTFKEENLEAILTITWVGFKAKLNAKFMPHNQVLRDGLELLALKQGEGLGSLAKHVQIFSALLCLVSQSTSLSLEHSSTNFNALSKRTKNTKTIYTFKVSYI
jgi:hypothetical protein